LGRASAGTTPVDVKSAATAAAANTFLEIDIFFLYLLLGMKIDLVKLDNSKRS
jgi:hypothetical protein